MILGASSGVNMLLIETSLLRSSKGIYIMDETKFDQNFGNYEPEWT